MLRNFDGEKSRLGNAEKFLLKLLEVPRYEKKKCTNFTLFIYLLDRHIFLIFKFKLPRGK